MNTNFFNRLPPEIICYIFDFLDPKSLHSASQVCKLWRVQSNALIPKKVGTFGGNIVDSIQFLPNGDLIILYCRIGVTKFELINGEVVKGENSSCENAAKIYGSINKLILLNSNYCHLEVDSHIDYLESQELLAIVNSLGLIKIVDASGSLMFYHKSCSFLTPTSCIKLLHLRSGHVLLVLVRKKRPNYQIETYCLERNSSCRLTCYSCFEMPNSRLICSEALLLPTGPAIVTVSENRKGIRKIEILSLPVGNRLKVLTENAGKVSCITTLCLKPRLILLASGSEDGIITIWNIPTGQCLRTLNVGFKVDHLALSAQRYLAFVIEKWDEGMSHVLKIVKLF